MLARRDDPGRMTPPSGMTRILRGMLDGARDGMRAGRQAHSALRDVGTGGGFLRHGSAQDDAARETIGLREELRLEARERAVLLEQIARAAEERRRN